MPMRDGFRTLITFQLLARVNFAELRIKPPGFDGRGGIDISNMRNLRFVTMWPKQLLKITDPTVTVQWDAELWDSARLWLLQQLQFIIITFPSGRQLGFYGWVDKFDPNEHREGEQPEATMTIVVSCINPAGVESTPALIPTL